MNQLISNLARARQITQEYKDELAEIEAEIAASRLGQRLERVKELLATAKADAQDADDAVRRATLIEYRRDGEKKPHPSVQVKMYTVLEYDPDEAKQFCLRSYPDGLNLNKRAFEKAARVLKPDCVTIDKEPRPTVAKDLSAYLRWPAPVAGGEE
jgi:hypothetical protein